MIAEERRNNAKMLAAWRCQHVVTPQRFIAITVPPSAAMSQRRCTASRCWWYINRASVLLGATVQRGRRMTPEVAPKKQKPAVISTRQRRHGYQSLPVVQAAEASCQ